jgi:hypothetical protein
LITGLKAIGHQASEPTVVVEHVVGRQNSTTSRPHLDTVRIIIVNLFIIIFFLCFKVDREDFQARGGDLLVTILFYVCIRVINYI